MVQATRAELRVQRREVLGKKVKRLRRRGLTPANIYGRNVESTAIQVATPELIQVLRRAGRNQIVYLSLDEEVPRPAFIRQVQRDPLTDEILHVDFHQILLTEKVRLAVPIVLAGKAPAVEAFGGTLLQSLDHIMVEGLPVEIPSQLEIEVGSLETLEAAIHVKDIAVAAALTVLTDPELVVATVAPPKVAEEVAAAAAPVVAQEEEGEREEA